MTPKQTCKEMPVHQYPPNRQDVINQREKQRLNVTPKELKSSTIRDWSVCPLEHFKPYNMQRWSLLKRGLC